MTGDEMERAIDFLLKGQANLELQVEKTSKQIAETDRQLAETSKMLRIQGDTLSTFIQVVKDSFSNLAVAQSRTDERLNALINVVEKNIGEGGHSQAP